MSVRRFRPIYVLTLLVLLVPLAAQALAAGANRSLTVQYPTDAGSSSELESLTAAFDPSQGQANFVLQFTGPVPTPQSGAFGLAVGMADTSNLACLEQPVDLVQSIFDEPHTTPAPTLEVYVHIKPDGSAQTSSMGQVSVTSAAQFSADRRTLGIRVTALALGNRNLVCAFATPVFGGGTVNGTMLPAAYFSGYEAARAQLLGEVHQLPTMTKHKAWTSLRFFLGTFGRVKSVHGCRQQGSYAVTCAFVTYSRTGVKAYGFGTTSYMLGDHGQVELGPTYVDFY
jgi:hypothetical protein